jgi:hypothetical protein
MKSGEEPSQESPEEISRNIRRKIAFLKRKSFVAQGETYNLAKEFFKSYIHKDEEFTTEELKHEMHKVYLSGSVRTRVEALLEKLSLLEYTDTQYSQEEVKLLLEELDSIIRDVNIEHKGRLPLLTRLANWLFRKKAVKQKQYISDYPALEENNPVAIELNTLLESMYAALDQGKKKKAISLYKEVSHKYNHLGSSIQEQFYHKLKAAYEELTRH